MDRERLKYLIDGKMKEGLFHQEIGYNSLLNESIYLFIFLQESQKDMACVFSRAGRVE